MNPFHATLLFIILAGMTGLSCGAASRPANGSLMAATKDIRETAPLDLIRSSAPVELDCPELAYKPLMDYLLELKALLEKASGAMSEEVKAQIKELEQAIRCAARIQSEEIEEELRRADGIMAETQNRITEASLPHGPY